MLSSLSLCVDLLFSRPRARLLLRRSCARSSMLWFATHVVGLVVDGSCPSRTNVMVLAPLLCALMDSRMILMLHFLSMSCFLLGGFISIRRPPRRLKGDWLRGWSHRTAEDSVITAKEQCHSIGGHANSIVILGGLNWYLVRYCY